MQVFAMQNKLDISPNGLIYTFALAVALRVVGLRGAKRNSPRS